MDGGKALEEAFGERRRNGKLLGQEDSQLDGIVLVPGFNFGLFDLRLGRGRLRLSGEPFEEGGQEGVMPAVIDDRRGLPHEPEGGEGRLKGDGRREAPPPAAPPLPPEEMAGALLNPARHTRLRRGLSLVGVGTEFLVPEEPQALLLPQVVYDLVHGRAYGVAEHHGRVETEV